MSLRKQQARLDPGRHAGASRIPAAQLFFHKKSPCLRRQGDFTRTKKPPFRLSTVGCLLMQDGVFEQAGLLAKLIASSAFPENSSGIIENAPLYSGGTAPESNRISLLSVSACPLSHYSAFSPELLEKNLLCREIYKFFLQKNCVSLP